MDLFRLSNISILLLILNLHVLLSILKTPILSQCKLHLYLIHFKSYTVITILQNYYDANDVYFCDIHIIVQLHLYSILFNSYNYYIV